MTIKVCNLGLKQPYFNRAYVVSGGFGWTQLYMAQCVYTQSHAQIVKIPMTYYEAPTAKFREF